MKIFLVLSLIFCLDSLNASERVVPFEGHAYTEDGKLAYIEQHILEQNEQGLAKKVTTRYFRPDGSGPFASLTSTFDGPMPSLPSTVFQDQRFKRQEIVNFDNNQETLVITHLDEVTERKKVERLRVTEQMVHSQGYHNLIVANFDRFKPGKTQVLDFVVPSRRAAYQFDLTFLGELENKNIGLQLDIKNWFLRLFAEKIVVEYDPETKYLMRYTGLTNIPNDKGENQSLDIKMIYDQASKKLPVKSLSRR